MSASCYLCSKAYTTISGKLVGDAFGICGICSILICVAHGHRNPHLPRYTCVICDSSVLAASATIRSQNSNAVNMLSETMISEAKNISSLDLFIEANREEYSWLSEEVTKVLSVAPGKFTTSFSENFWFGLNKNSKQLLAGSIAIVLHYEIAEEELIYVLQVLVREWRDIV